MPNTGKRRCRARSELLTLSEAARYTGFSVSSLRRAIERHDLASYRPLDKVRPIMVSAEQLDRWIAP